MDDLKSGPLLKITHKEVIEYDDLQDVDDLLFDLDLD